MTLPAFTGECFINGRWLMGGGPEFASIASADGLEVWRGHEASVADVEAAVSAARAALPAWRSMATTGVARRLSAMPAMILST